MSKSKKSLLGSTSVLTSSLFVFLSILVLFIFIVNVSGGFGIGPAILLAMSFLFAFMGLYGFSKAKSAGRLTYIWKILCWAIISFTILAALAIVYIMNANWGGY